MARARLHLICGNCGCNDMWKFNIDLQGQDYGDRFEPDVFIECGNCTTLHSLAEQTEQKQKQKQNRKPGTFHKTII